MGGSLAALKLLDEPSLLALSLLHTTSTYPSTKQIETERGAYISFVSPNDHSWFCSQVGVKVLHEDSTLQLLIVVFEA